MRHLDEGTLQTWLDRERAGLDPSELAAIEGHLNACAECAARLDELETLDGRAHALLAVGADADERPPFGDVVQRAQGTRQRQRALTRLRSIAWAASVVLAVGVGWMTNDLYRGGVRPAPSLAPAAEMERPASLSSSDDETERAAPPSPDVEAARASRFRQSAEAAPTEPARAEPAPPANAAPAAPRTLVADAGRAAADAQVGISGDADDRVDSSTGAAPAAREPTADLTRDSFADAENVGTVVVSGRIEDDQSGEPLASAQVFVEGLRVGALTRQDGTFSLTLPALGDDRTTSYELTAQRIGYRTQRRELAARPGDSLVADFTMPEEAIELQEVVVTGTAGVSQRRAVGNAVGAVQAVAQPGDWTPSTLQEAEASLGTVWLVPDLEVVSVETAPVAETGSSFVRVRQRMEDGSVLRLVQGEADAGAEAWVMDTDDAVESRRIGDVLITGTAPIPAEELRRLLGTLR